MQRPGQSAGLLAVERHRLGEQTDQRRVGGVVAEQVRGDPVRHPQRPGQERPVGVVDLHQRPVDQRRAGQQPRPGRRRRRRDVGQRQRQTDRRAPPGDVVVEVAVEPLEPAVQVGHQRDHQQFDVELGQSGVGARAGAAGSTRRPAIAASASASTASRAAQSGRGGCRGGGEQLVDDLLGEVQPAERVVRRRVVGAAVQHERADPVLDQADPAQQVAPGSGRSLLADPALSPPACRRLAASLGARLGIADGSASVAGGRRPVPAAAVLGRTPARLPARGPAARGADSVPGHRRRTFVRRRTGDSATRPNRTAGSAAAADPRRGADLDRAAADAAGPDARPTGSTAPSGRSPDDPAAARPRRRSTCSRCLRAAARPPTPPSEIRRRLDRPAVRPRTAARCRSAR